MKTSQAEKEQRETWVIMSTVNCDDDGLTSVVNDPVTVSLVMSANVCCPLGCFFTRSKGTDISPSKESDKEITFSLVVPKHVGVIAHEQNKSL